MDDSYELLIDLLADVRAVFWPTRLHMTSMSAAVAKWELQQAYPVSGLPWASEKASEAGRKWSQRSLEWLADEGLVRTFRHAGRSVGVQLTERGLQTGEELACITNGQGAFETLQRLLKLRSEGHDKNYLEMFAGWIPETLLSGVEWGNDTKPFVETQLDALPGIVRGWITTNCTMQGHLWYSVTADGEEAATSPTNGELLPALPEANEEALDLFRDRFDQALARLAAMSPKDSGEIGPIALPVAYKRCANA